MKNRYIPAFVMLSAGLVCACISILRKWDVLYSLITLLLVLLVFFCLGSVAEYIIRKVKEENLAQQKEKMRLEQEMLEKQKAEEEALEGEQDENEENDKTLG